MTRVLRRYPIQGRRKKKANDVVGCDLRLSDPARAREGRADQAVPPLAGASVNSGLKGRSSRVLVGSGKGRGGVARLALAWTDGDLRTDATTGPVGASPSRSRLPAFVLGSGPIALSTRRPGLHALSWQGARHGQRWGRVVGESALGIGKGAENVLCGGYEVGRVGGVGRF